MLKWTAIGLAITLALGGIGGFVAYKYFWNNIKPIDEIPDPPGKPRPAKLNNAMNILLMGTDSRAGANTRYGREDGERSDTTILLHLSAGGQRAVAISFPRDSMVQVPDCQVGKKTVPGGFRMINSAFAYGGATCTVQTVEALTKIRVDHYLKVDFTGFKNIVDALGGVEICAPYPFTDRDSKLTITKSGRQKINGEQALGWVRVRHIGDGTDIGRIQRQQQFLSSVIKKATSQGVLTNPLKLTKFVNAATKSLSADRGFSGGTIIDLAGKLKGLNLAQIEFKTIPWRYALPAERKAHKDWNGRVFWLPQAEDLFTALRQDNKVPAPADTPKPAATTATRPIPASKIKVRLYNGTLTSGLAGRAVTTLAAKKYQASLGSTTTYAGGTLPRTLLRFGPGAKAAAAQVAALLPGTRPKGDPKLAPGTVYLYLGADFTAFSGLTTPLPKSAGDFTAKEDICKTG
ncbi:LCP family protein [Actinocorallia longicatena]|uniref:LCP family protein n=1 Tax=Actinocorallia longicatena TaxID=111803 RepID=UPI0031D5571C